MYARSTASVHVRSVCMQYASGIVLLFLASGTLKIGPFNVIKSGYITPSSNFNVVVYLEIKYLKKQCMIEP